MQLSGASNQKSLMTYWIIYSSLSCFEYILHGVCDFLLFYWLGKCIFLIWYLKSKSSLGENSFEQLRLPSFGKSIIEA